MVSSLRQRGYDAGFKLAKEAKASGVDRKKILAYQADDRKIAKELMEELKDYNVRWDKCFSLAISYSWGFDQGVAHYIYYGDET